MASGPIVRRWRGHRSGGAGGGVGRVGVAGGVGRGVAAVGAGRRRWAQGRRQGGRGRGGARTAASPTGVRRARTTGASGNGGPGRIGGPTPARPGRAGRRQRPDRGFGASLAAASRPPVAVGSSGLCAGRIPIDEAARRESRGGRLRPAWHARPCFGCSGPLNAATLSVPEDGSRRVIWVILFCAGRRRSASVQARGVVTHLGLNEIGPGFRGTIGRVPTYYGYRPGTHRSFQCIC